MVSKVVQKGAKSELERLFFGIGETLIFDDSIMIFMVFWCPEGSLEVQNIVQNYDLASVSACGDCLSGMQIP